MAHTRRRLSFVSRGEEGQGNICVLCNSHSVKLTSPQTWKDERAQIVAKSLHLSSEQSICQACRGDIRRLTQDPDHVPRWTKPKEIHCCIPGCNEMSFTQTQTVSEDHIALALGIAVTPPIPTPLCKSHYYTIYKTLQPTQSHCPTCGSSLKGSSTRTCPNPGKIQEYLSKNTGFEGVISNECKVCFACYKSHLQILKCVKTISTDSGLSALINALKLTLIPTTDISSIDSAVDHSLTLTAMYVGETILKHEAILLPQVHEIFSSFVAETLSTSNLEWIDEPKGLVTARYILSHLTTTLQHHLSCVCKVKKYGTLLYRSNGDTLHALTCSLHKSSKTNTACTLDESNAPVTGNPSEVILDLNSRIHQQVKKFLADDALIPFQFDRLSIDTIIADLDPNLWSAICSLTTSVSERRQTLRDNTTHAQHVKKVRRFYCLCALMFCTDDRCYLPLHNLITDVVDSLGGSTQLLKILNRLGVCSSSDTLARSIQHRVTEREKKGPEQECFRNSITFISADNIDFLHSYAQVFRGNQSSSWHGTTVQAVQPSPSLKLDSSTPELSELVRNISMNTESETTACAYDTTGDVTPATLTSDVDLNGRHSECAYNIPLWLLCRKRAAEKRSPRSSPLKVCRSPAPKIRRRARSRLESTETRAEPLVVQQLLTRGENTSNLKDCSVSTFQLTADEVGAWDALTEELNMYMLHQHKNNTGQPIINIQDYLRVTKPTQPEKSNVVYLDVLDAKADSKDTIMQVLHDLHKRYVEGHNREWVLIEGDAKVYEILQSLKYEYGEELKWMLPYPGDWHMLKNYQVAIMKPYFDAGLKQLAQAVGYPTVAIQGCSQFKRTHRFLLEAWESLYRTMVEKYLETQENASECTVNTDLVSQAIATAFQQATSTEPLELSKILSQVQSLVKQSGYHTQFSSFLEDLSSTDSTWKFWVQFVFKDALAYVSLYLALRSGNWNLRVASLKMMAAVFSAFDHFNYRKLIAQHLADLLGLPQSVLQYFRKGAFVVSITGRAWHSVGVDEAHEMLINKACKTAVVHPSKDYISRVASYLPYRTKCMENLRQQIFPEESIVVDENPTSLFTTRSEDKKSSLNIDSMIALIKSAGLLQPTINNRGLINPFSNKTASPEQEHDLLQFRKIGTTEFEKYIVYYILKQASVHPPNRKKRLMTFSERKTGKRTVSQLEKDKKLVQKCLHKKMKWSQQMGKPVERVSEQYISLPLALANSDGSPRKGQKSYATKTIETRYKTSSPPVILNSLPIAWIPECCILEGMFMLNTTPLGSHRTFGDYSQFLMKRFILPQFRNGAHLVHVIFDNPGRLYQTPKYFERKRRDATASIAAGHTCDDIQTSLLIPSKWRANMINCRTCKRNLVIFLTSYFLNHMSKFLRLGEMFVVAGGFDGDIQDTAWYVTSSGEAQPEPAYTSNAEETDTRLWLHVRHSPTSKILIISPDTDIYHIGLALDHGGEKDVIIQISLYNSKDLRYLHLNAFITVLKNDPDLSAISRNLIPQVIQTIFVVTGCDYVSFFCGIGKATFMRYFYQYAEFISGGKDTTPGTLADTGLDELNTGFLAFLRLVGTVYFKTHALAFPTPSPVTLFNKYNNCTTTLEQHCLWLEDIRQNIWDRIQFEDETIPSIDALHRHWKRACWVVDMWHQSTRNNMELKNLTDFGWIIEGDKLSFDWDSPENVAAIQQRVASLIRGCKCRTGCGTLRCGCKKNGKHCSEGCECRNCCNTATAEPATNISLHHLSLEEEIDDHLAKEVDEIMEWVFGNSHDESDSTQHSSDLED